VFIQHFSGIYVHLLLIVLQFLRFRLIFYDIFLNVDNLLLRFVFVSVSQHNTCCRHNCFPATIMWCDRIFKIKKCNVNADKLNEYSWKFHTEIKTFLVDHLYRVNGICNMTKLKISTRNAFILVWNFHKYNLCLKKSINLYRNVNSWNK